jgi:hypothetical protein
VRLAEVAGALPVPRRDVGERLLPHVLHTRTLDPWIEVHDVDELRAAPVRRGRDGTCKVFFTERGGDVHQLALLDVRPELDDESGKPVGAFVHRRRRS